MDYLYGIDLFNFAYWWECHEVFEGLWHAVGPDTEQGTFFQALIQLAAANLKRFVGNEQAAQKLARSGLARLQTLPHLYMGLDMTDLSGLVQDDLDHPGEVRMLLRLSGL
jgi:predicted metal-dependent hydrolase